MMPITESVEAQNAREMARLGDFNGLKFWLDQLKLNGAIGDYKIDINVTLYPVQKIETMTVEMGVGTFEGIDIPAGNAT